MKKIKTTLHTSGNGFDITLKNDSLTVPDQQKAYIVSTGCGAGKTESIKSLIPQVADKGVIYCIDVIREADKMKYSLINEKKVPESDILIIHSGDSAKDELQDYLENPEKIMSIKILIITHVRFWTDLINYFMIYKPSLPVPTFDGDFKALMARDDLRQYIIFDETPTFFKSFANFPRPFLGCFSEKIGSKWQCKGKSELRESYDLFVANTSYDLTKKSHKMGRIKRDVILECIPKYWDEWIGIKDSDMKISFYPSDLCQDVIKTHILIYEGVGEVLLTGTTLFELLNIPDKYNSTVNFNPIPEPQERKKPHDEIKFSEMINNLAGVLNGRLDTKTLIVVWKNIGESNNDEPSGESSWVKLIDTHLMKNGFKPEIHYSITYFGSNKTKSTNEFRDYTGIILMGDWNVPDPFAASIRRAFVSKTSIEDYRLWYYVQLISRIGIRNLDGGVYDVWYSSDYKPKFINCLDMYFNKNTYTPKVKLSHGKWLDSKAKALKIRKGQILDIEKLAIHYPSLKTSIIAGHNKTFSITLNEIYSICPKSEKKSKSYVPLKNALKKLGITLKIS